MKRTSTKKARAAVWSRRIALWIWTTFVFLVGVLLGVFKPPSHTPIAATAFTVCGIPVGTVVIFRNGDQSFLPNKSDKLRELMAKVPDDSKMHLNAPAPVCQHPDAKIF